MTSPNKLRIGVLCGGKSGEHQVSLISAFNIQQRLDPEKYEIHMIPIDPQGQWYLGTGADFLQNAESVKNARMNQSLPRVALTSGRKLVDLASGKKLAEIDVFFPITHGRYGEDGAIQGLLKWFDVPFVGPDVSGSAIGMDKDLSKRLLHEAGIPVTPSITLRGDNSVTYQDVVAKLGNPVFIKPCREGSSLGTQKAVDEPTFRQAVKTALEFDDKVLVEEFVQAREIECAVLGNLNPEASLVLGEIAPTSGFYSYEAKYVDKDGASLMIPAELPADVTEKLRETAVTAFKVLECQGLARVDFFVKQDLSFYLNEVNTLPGFTQISMYPKLWEASGVPYSELLDRLIQFAIERFNRENPKA
ncbi:MAG: D-alanine--D-alanine ligase [SAR324 cluster bacterium]|nr:D-alanine--D-alanine ligase [SAR324 cluster bacterium]